MNMHDMTFKALVVHEAGEGRFRRVVEQRRVSDLPGGDVLVRVHYSSLNYKDALSASGNRGVTRKYPHTPGIDAAGEVVSAPGGGPEAGTKVLVCGYDLGMNTAGGFGQYIRVPATWVVECPVDLSLLDAMRIGTAGFTAAQCVAALQEAGSRQDNGPVLVTGATGGVGSIAVILLARRGFKVTAVTGKETAHAFLRELGATDILTREQATAGGNRMLLRERWEGVVDTVGGDTLATAIKSTRYGGTVTCCGNAASGDLPLSVYPFILRGVRLIGIDSAQCSRARREEIWNRLSGAWRIDNLADISTVIPLAELDGYIERMLQGTIRGRVVVDMQEGE